MPKFFVENLTLTPQLAVSCFGVSTTELPTPPLLSNIENCIVLVLVENTAKIYSPILCTSSFDLSQNHKICVHIILLLEIKKSVYR